MERRQNERCPVCQGPTKQETDGEIRCRKSICSYNFRNIICPRCGAKGPEAHYDAKQALHFTCQDCQNRWSDS